MENARLKILVLTLLAAISFSSSAFPVSDTLRVCHIEHDTDLWTCGQLLQFSCKGTVSFNSHGRVVSGVLGVNTIILCADSKFREFAKDCEVRFDDNGLLVAGTPAVGLEIVIQEQLVTTVPHTEIAFYPNGRIKCLVPFDSFRYASSDGFKFSVSSGRRVMFGNGGWLKSATIARRRVLQFDDGYQRVFVPGDLVFLDEDGRVIR